ncbi:putative reverse transcriptase domain-containing protein [Tanacetum coccineum]
MTLRLVFPPRRGVTGSILNYEDLKAKFRSHFSQQKKFTKTHLAVHNIKQREGESTKAFITRYTDDTLQGLMEKTYTWIEAREVATNGTQRSSWDNNRGQKGKDRFSPYRGPNHGLLSNLSKSPREILATEKADKSFEQPPQGKKDKSTAPAEAPILMIRQDESYTKNKFESLTFEGKEITFPSGDSNSSALVVIKAKIFGREVNRVHMDDGSSCEVIYEYCFMKLKLSIRASKIDSKVPLVGFLGEKSWSIRKIPLEITIGDAPLTRKETLDFAIVKSDFPYNMLLGRTTMQRMGIVVSTIHGAIKFHTTEGIGTVFSTYESDKVKEGVKKVRKTPAASEKGVFSCTTTEEKVIINNKYPEQTVTIKKQLPKHFKRRLRDLLKANADVFA